MVLSGAPDEPRAAVSEGAVLFPRTEMLAATDAFPASAHDGEVRLTCEKVLSFAP